MATPPVLPDAPSDFDLTRTSAISSRPSVRFGSYRLLQRLGEGGMGEVWLAQQVEPVQRQVALKVVKAGMDSAHVVARFEAERQTLALMDHPTIAKVFDAGTTPEGRPYFAMDYVRGEPITAYCDRQRLSVRERLELFIQLCEGVQQVSDFLIGLFRVSDPSEARGNALTAREILSRGSEQLESSLRDQPQVQARLEATIGLVYTGLGLYGEAQRLLDRALQTQRRVAGEDSLETGHR